MSLTSHLSQQDSPIRAFMQQRFSASGEFVRRNNAVLTGLDTLKPQSDKPPYALLGTAIDYRIRYYFEDAINQTTVAQQGAALLSPGHPLDLGNVMVCGSNPVPGTHPTLSVYSFDLIII